jgi:hypothetical protein
MEDDFCTRTTQMRKSSIDLAQKRRHSSLMTFATFYFFGYFTDASREGAVAG